MRPASLRAAVGRRSKRHPATARRACLTASVVATALTAGLAACGGSGAGSSAGREESAPRVVATTTYAADFARAIGGDGIQVTQILRPGVDPHDYEPSPADLAAIADADLLIENGVGLESWLDDAISASGFDGTEVVMADGVTIRHPDDSEEAAAAEAHDEHEDHEEGDPHIWHDPRNVKIMVGNIEKGLAAVDPESSAEYQANLAAYRAKLDELDSETQREIDSIPVAHRKLVTNHDSFGYYVQRYGLEFVGSIIPSFDTSAELSGRSIDDIVGKIRASGAVAVFSESSLPPRTAQTIGSEAGVRVISGEDALYADTLGPAGSAGATYLEAQRHNTDTIVDALR
ncbi:manganese/iron transport system substrate-binding protein [Parafrankia irregularis]|uniref:Manganese/iron transport system substrate-binding protein n=1 Tax=Parafrankia irregularis TaxID=795642 RepID=A0A0S4QP35_9ACTN|nr:MULTISPECIES: metal ABC transporter substrate-binding protein [Parafrankia]MBE3204258.1 zinc ABC transporter substrate-binding protein [Parafrankia sp. CH37]CUU57229.1 manganese/iron transport system substrate-binding protein [Parafrankia irregularis]